MHCFTRKLVRALALTTIVSACSEQSPQPTAARSADSPPLLTQTGGSCSPQLASQISKEQKALFARATLSTAQDLFKVISNGCPSTTEQAYAYVQFTIDQFHAGNVLAQPTGTPADAIVAHWNSILTYVGLAAPNVPSSVLGDDANAGVMTQAGGTRDLLVNPGPQGLGAGLHVPDNAAPGGSHIYTIQLIAANCLTTTLGQTGACYHFNSYPAVASFNPKFTAVICQPGHLDQNLALGHTRADGTNEVLPRPAGPLYPLLCPEPVASFGNGIFGRALAAVVRALTPKPAYAFHGGLGGLGGGMSPFGGVALTFFNATFTADAIGGPPGTPERGNWTTISAQPPGSITVQRSFADLTDKPVVLNQAGGNCANNCGGLSLIGTATTASEVNTQSGVYVVSWNSVEDKPSPKDGPFIVRSLAGLEIARLSYATTNSADQLTYNGQLLPIGWTQHVSQFFEIVVNLDTKTTSLRIDGTPIAGFQNLPFVNASAVDVGTVGAEFVGIDAGIIGWDNVSIVKVAPAAP